eukprot:TRINITY_DN5392_c0_g1_i1.p1 TRINITY_DN5392_c0_g1~~TRINITY_DN5392_c0_g1_i1.p1  ORF type:complete len:406 (-),score=104.37 TRINITY_DN5392_c0_g1_i1:43-1260(-)
MMQRHTLKPHPTALRVLALHAMALVLLLSLWAGAAYGHICILEPVQRGGVDVSIPGSPACYRRTPYCGGVAPGAPSASYTAGARIDVHLQQNLNHFWVQDPGFFDIAISYDADPNENSWIILDRWDDWAANDMVWQMNFTRSVLLPEQPCSSCILRTRYVSHNVDEVDPADNLESIFYNCADISLVASAHDHGSPPSTASAPSRAAPLASSDRALLEAPSSSIADNSCCAPSQFTAKGESSVGGALHTSHTIYFDRDRQYVRWDRVGSVQSLITIANYTAGNTTTIEYLISPADQTCEIYGSDRFYDWCFGEDRSQIYAGSLSMPGSGNAKETVRIWENFGNGFRFEAIVNGSDCVPSAVYHEAFAFRVSSFALSVDPSVFTPPSYCPSPRGLLEQGVTRCGKLA